MTRTEKALSYTALLIGIAVFAMLLAPRFGLTPEILPAAYVDSWQALGFLLPAGALIYGARKDRNAMKADALIPPLAFMFGVLGLIYALLMLSQID